MSEEKYEGWAILELMGHRRLGGYVREVTMFGGAFARIDIPCEPPATQFYGASAIFCMTPTTEEIAKAVGKNAAPAPVARWELPPAPEARESEPPDDEEDDRDTSGGPLF